MRDRLSLSLGSSITLALVLGYVGVIAIAATAYQRLRQFDADARLDQAAMTLADAAATQVRPGFRDSADSTQDICDNFVHHPQILAMAVWDQSGRIMAEAVVDGDLKPIIAQPLDGDASGPSIRHLPVFDSTIHDVVKVRRVDLPLGTHFRSERPGRLAILVRPATAAASSSWWSLMMFVVPVCGAGGVGILVSNWWFRRRVVHPVAGLLTAVQTGKVGDARVSPTTRRDEMGEIARAILELFGRANNWQEKATRIERSLTSRVAEETRQIHKDMKKIERQAWVDPLTGLKNRRLLEEKFGEIHNAQKRTGGDLSVVMMDLDNFKVLNDTLGHRAGDEILSFTGELIRQHLRPDDSAVRYGGDEFLLILPGVSAEQAQFIASRVIALFSQRAKLLPVSPQLSMSAGVASQLNNYPQTPHELIELADRALYEAKQGGKNAVRLCSNVERLAPL